MPDNNTLIAISAFSGLAGALLTQTMSGLFAYYSDKRKTAVSDKKEFRDKKVEIAEHFYFVTGETMTVLRKSINYYKNRNESRGDISLEYLHKERHKLDEYLDKLKQENWKQNLIGLYFEVSLSYPEIIEANSRSHSLFLQYLDLAEKLLAAAPTQKEGLYGRFNLIIFDLCMQYEAIYELLEKDMNRVKAELLEQFGLKT